MANMTPIKLEAFGRFAKLGELYDARNDEFLTYSIFEQSELDKLISKEPKDSVIDLKDDNHSALHYFYENTYEEMFAELKISAGLKLSILGDVFKLNGSGELFGDFKKSTKGVKASVMNSISTKYQSIDISNKKVLSKDIIKTDLLKPNANTATHIVVGILWGGNVYVSIEDKTIKDEFQLDVKSKLKLKLPELAGMISGKADTNLGGNIKVTSELSNFEFFVNGDIVPEKTPANLEIALDFMKNANNKLREANDGKGKPIKYTLMPINSLKELMKIKFVDSVINEIDGSSVHNCVIMFDRIIKNEQKINDLVNLVESFKKYLPTDKTEELSGIKLNYKNYRDDMKKLLKENLILARSGDKKVDEFESNIERESKGHRFSWCKIEENFKRLSDELREEISFLQYLDKEEIIHLHEEYTLDMFLHGNPKYDVYILYYSKPNLIHIANTIEILSELKKKKRETDKFVAIKSNSIESKLSFYRNNRLITDNYEKVCRFPDGIETGLLSIPIMQEQWKKLLNRSDFKNHLRYRELASIESNLLEKIDRFVIHTDVNGAEVFLLTHSDDVYAFGRNYEGRLGNVDAKEVKDPTVVPELCQKGIKDIKCGDVFSVALTQTGQIYTFGLSSTGKCGNGDSKKYQRPVEISVDNQTITAIDCTDRSTYVLTQSGQLYWFGFLNGITALTPTKVVFPSEIQIKSISCGYNHILALTVDEDAFGWGNNISGQLGLCHYEKTDSPQMIEMKVKIKQVYCGRSHSLLLTNNGKIYSMGFNELGELGIGIKTDRNLQNFDQTTKLINRAHNPLGIPLFNYLNPITAGATIANNVLQTLKSEPEVHTPKLALSEQKEICCYEDMSMSLDINNKLYIWGKLLCNKNGLELPFATGLTSFQEGIDAYAERRSTLKPLSSVEMFNPYYFYDKNSPGGLFGKIQFYSSNI